MPVMCNGLWSRELSAGRGFRRGRGFCNSRVRERSGTGKVRIPAVVVEIAGREGIVPL